MKITKNGTVAILPNGNVVVDGFEFEDELVDGQPADLFEAHRLARVWAVSMLSRQMSVVDSEGNVMGPR